MVSNEIAKNSAQRSANGTPHPEKKSVSARGRGA